VLAVCAVAALAYVIDYAQIQYRAWRNQNAFGTVQVDVYYAVKEKANKTEYMFPQQAETQTCVHALFPHMGFSPCWYLTRHREQRVDI
jgi:hypothetical protein